MGSNKTVFSRSAIVALALAAVSAGADDSFYLAAGFGNAEDSVLEATDTGWRLAGGYHMNKYLGFEMSLVSLGAPAAGDVEFSQGGLGLFGRVRFPIGTRFELFGKAGYFSWNVDVNSAGGGGNASGTDPAWGLGAGYNVSDNFRVDFQHERFTNVLGSDVDMQSLNGVFRFE